MQKMNLKIQNLKDNDLCLFQYVNIRKIIVAAIFNQTEGGEEMSKRMSKKIIEFLKKHAVLLLCGIVTMAAPLISQNCQTFWYQEKEPDGLAEFGSKRR